MMDKIIPWNEWIDLIKPYYPSGKRGRPTRGIETMLRMYLMQNWFNLSGVLIIEEVHIVDPFTAALIIGPHSPVLKPFDTGSVDKLHPLQKIFLALFFETAAAFVVAGQQPEVHNIDLFAAVTAASPNRRPVTVLDFRNSI
ncbi:MAG: hypothetical protein IJ126_03325 [Lachnospiraceae bacterium]|nr:hypothetical protein [Lachnospiraceae bacterium]